MFGVRNFIAIVFSLALAASALDSIFVLIHDLGSGEGFPFDTFLLLISFSLIVWSFLLIPTAIVLIIFLSSRAGRFTRLLFYLSGIFYLVAIVALVNAYQNNSSLSASRLSSLEVSGADSTNLLVITADTLRMDRLGGYGNPRIHTPVMDRLCHKGIQLSNCYSNIPRTNPSHGCMFSGLMPYQHGSVANGQPINRDVITLARMLSGKGYLCLAVISAWTLHSDISGLQAGFQLYDEKFSPAIYPNDQCLTLFCSKLLMRMGILPGSYWDTVESRAENTTDRALNLVKAMKERNWFLWVHYFDPHTPYRPPAPLDSLYHYEPEPFVSEMGMKVDAGRQRALYDSEVAYLDVQLGRLLKELDERGMLDNTVIIFISDHGESLGEHQYYFDHGQHLYEPSTRIPLLIIPAEDSDISPQIREGLCSIIDLIPTVSGLIGLDIESLGLAGRNILIENAQVKPTRVYLQTSLVEKYRRGLEFRQKVGIIHGNIKVIMGPNRTVEVYDLLYDAQEVQGLEGADIDDGLLADIELFYQQATSVTGSLKGLSPAALDRLRDLGYIK